MRLREVFQYEIAYRLRSRSTWAYAAFLFIVVWAFVGSAEDTVINRNAPLRAAQGIVLFGGMFGVLVSAALFGDATIRDVAAGMDSFLYTTRVTKAEYLGGRFLAAFATNAVLALGIPLGFWVATVTIAEPDFLGANRLAAYAQPLVLFLWPNIFLVGAVQFTLGALARQVIPVYVSAAGLFIGYIVAANYWSEIHSPVLSALADPLGINALVAMTRYWTPADVNTRLVGFPAMLVWNRVLWLAIGVGVLAFVHHRFRFAHPSMERSRRRVQTTRPTYVEPRATYVDSWPTYVDARPTYVEPRPTSLGALTTYVGRVLFFRPAFVRPAASSVDHERSREVPRVSGVFTRATRVQQTLSIARQSLAEVMSGRGFQVGFLVTIGLVLLWGWNVGDTIFDTSMWPVTHLVVGEVLSRRAPFIPWLVIAVYAGELVWKHREAGTAEMVDAAPVRISVALLGRFLALLVIIVGFQAALMIGACCCRRFRVTTITSSVCTPASSSAFICSTTHFSRRSR
jgi:ABC-type transport system involved in multi-copper enzyme maturation permease subunit